MKTEKQLNDWWQDLDFNGMSKASGWDWTDFMKDDGLESEEDAEAEFVRVCDIWWKQKSLTEKQSIYNVITLG